MAFTPRKDGNIWREVVETLSGHYCVVRISLLPGSAVVRATLFGMCSVWILFGLCRKNVSLDRHGLSNVHVREYTCFAPRVLDDDTL